MSELPPDQGVIQLVYKFTDRQDFNQAAHELLQFLSAAQRDHPNQPRKLHLYIEGHRLPNGNLDLDAMELQSKFLFEFLLQFFTSAKTPNGEFKNPQAQVNVIPPLNIFSRHHPGR